MMIPGIWTSPRSDALNHHPLEQLTGIKPNLKAPSLSSNELTAGLYTVVLLNMSASFAFLSSYIEDLTQNSSQDQRPMEPFQTTQGMTSPSTEQRQTEPMTQLSLAPSHGEIYSAQLNTFHTPDQSIPAHISLPSTNSTTVNNTTSPSFEPEKLNDLPVYGFCLIAILFFSIFANLIVAMCVMRLGRETRDVVQEKEEEW